MCDRTTFSTPLYKATKVVIIARQPTAMEQSPMIESWQIDSRDKLIDHLRHFRYDRFDIIDMYLSNELPDFIESESDAEILALDVWHGVPD